MATVWDHLELSRAEIALLVSVVGGIVVTAIWSETSHALLRRYYDKLDGRDRSPFIAAAIGVLERLLLTMLTLWLQSALGAIVAAITGVKAVMGWGDLTGDSRAGRTRYAVAFMNSLVSIIWAVGWGIWATHSPHLN